ncbi:RNA methyltransferase [Thermoactinomyces daqus]|uniref:RNA methyltransferase n=1 Tax=Thermoactinomyces daqus TaxID=1329516 RepID=A0A7W1XBP9_9BACL|nr:RNA methyltransferase [Thermoactinomyces daqus]MBA4543745.1 RNA methyltransferase [Thermoactinomyces daqus]
MTKIRLITSQANEQVKQWQKLKTKKGRLQQGALLIEGEHLMEEALKAGIPFFAVLLEQGKTGITEPLLHRFPERVPVYELAPPLFRRLVETETPQGIAAVIRLPEWSPDELLARQKQEATYLLLDAIQDPGNLGTIIRTAKAAGVDGILLGKGTVDPFNSKAVRAAMGSIFRIPLVQADLAEAIGMLGEQGVTVVGTTPHAGVYHFDYPYSKRVAILLGNEGRGVHPDLLARADVQVKIPMPGQTESLNVSSVGAILLFERVRQQYQHK